MKQHKFISLFAVGIAMIAGSICSSCSDDNDDAVTGGLSIKAVIPTKVIAGQEITITGSGLDDVTAVIFPGDVRATEITKIGSGLISVKTPAGISPDGGRLSVETGSGDATSFHADLTIGNPFVRIAAPTDREIKISENLEVYGSDLEFMTKAVFPGANDNDVEVNAIEFRRKSTSALIIPVPTGIKAGQAEVILVDCSGKTYNCPAVTLSDEISGGGVEVQREQCAIWEGEFQVSSWNWFEPSAADFNWQGFKPRAGERITFVFEDNNDNSRFCYCRGNWDRIDLGGESDPNNVGIPTTVNKVTITLTDDLISDFLNGSPVFHVSGTDFKLTQILYEYVPDPTIWTGEASVNEWVYINVEDLYTAETKAEIGATLRFMFADHDADAPMYMYSTWWSPVDLGNGGAQAVTVPAGTNSLDYTLDEYVTNAINGEWGGEGTNVFIIGGNGSMTLTEIRIIK